MAVVCRLVAGILPGSESDSQVRRALSTRSLSQRGREKSTIDHRWSGEAQGRAVTGQGDGESPFYDSSVPHF